MATWCDFSQQPCRRPFDRLVAQPRARTPRCAPRRAQLQAQSRSRRRSRSRPVAWPPASSCWRAKVVRPEGLVSLSAGASCWESARVPRRVGFFSSESELLLVSVTESVTAAQLTTLARQVTVEEYSSTMVPGTRYCIVVPGYLAGYQIPGGSRAKRGRSARNDADLRKCARPLFPAPAPSKILNCSRSCKSENLALRSTSPWCKQRVCLKAGGMD